MKAFRFYRRYWAAIGGLIFVGLAFMLGILGIYTLWYMATHIAVPSYCWWAPIIAFPFVAFTTILLPILLFKRRDTPYAFAEHQAEDFAIKGGIATLFRKK